MSYGGRLLAEVRAHHPEWYQLVEFALNEARVGGKREGESAFRARLTGAEGMSTEGLALWSQMGREYGCFVSVGFTPYGWSCAITCPDTDVTRVVKHLDPESALRACVAAWGVKMRARNPHLEAEGVTIP